MGEKKRPSVRKVITVALVYMAALVLMQAFAIVLLTTTLHSANATLIDSLVSVRAMRQMQVNLLAHDDSVDPLERAALEARIRNDLSLLGGLQVLSPDVFARTKEQVDSYLRSPDENVAIPFHVLGELIDTRMDVANDARLSIAQWDRLAKAVGAAVILLAVGGLVVAAYWSSQAFVQPLSTLSEAVRRFARGDEHVRAPHAAVRELDDISEEFNEMSQILLRRRETMLQYVASVAHDLRNPIATLRLSASSIRDDEPLPDEKRLRRTLALIQRQIGRLDRMVEDLLDRARIESGQLDLQKEDTDAVALATNVVSLFSDTSSAHTLTLHAHASKLPIWGDGARIEQALVNLVSNAIKYSPSGGPIDITVEPDATTVTYSVADEGLGIPPDEIPHIWEPFKRAGGERAFIPGAGLGLPTVRRIVEAHGGHVSVKSTRGEGSVFSMTLPLGERVDSHAPPPSAAEPTTDAPSNPSSPSPPPSDSTLH